MLMIDLMCHRLEVSTVCVEVSNIDLIQTRPAQMTNRTRLLSDDDHPANDDDDMLCALSKLGQYGQRNLRENKLQDGNAPTTTP